MEFENNNIDMNEEMSTDLVEFEDLDGETEKKSGLSTLAAMAIGAGVTAATFGVVKLVKKGINKLKAKKEASEAAEEFRNNKNEDECVLVDDDVDDE